MHSYYFGIIQMYLIQMIHIFLDSGIYAMGGGGGGRAGVPELGVEFLEIANSHLRRPFRAL